MSRLFSVAGFIVIVVALTNSAHATEATPCAPELQPSASEQFSAWVQTAIVDHAKRPHSSRGAAFAKMASKPDGKDLAEKRAEMKEIYDRLQGLSEDQRTKVFENLGAVAGKMGPKSMLEVQFLHAIQFSGDSVGWALDWNGTVERTSDGGVTWNNTRIASPPWLVQRADPGAGIFRNMHFADAEFGLVVGMGPPYWTMDGGLTWHGASPPALLHRLQSVFCDPSHGCWVAGDKQNAIYRREPAQSNWTLQRSPAKGVVNAIQFLGPKGWAVSDNGEIVGTTDGGQHWNELFRDETKKFKALHFVDEQNGWAVGNRALIMRTQDGGKIWVDQTIPTPPGFPLDEVRLHAVKFANPKLGWAAGLHGMIFGTTDGGACWRMQRFEGLKGTNWLTIYALAVTDGPTVWAAGNVGNIFVSTDGGAFWFPVHGLAVDVIRQLKRAMDGLAKR